MAPLSFLKVYRPLKQIFNQDALGWVRVLEIQPSISCGIYYTRVVDFHLILCSVTAFDEVNFNGARCLLLHVWAPNAVVQCMQSTGHMECISGHRTWVNFHQYERRLLHSHLFSCVFIWRHLVLHSILKMLSIIQSEAEQRKSALKHTL